MENLKNNDLYQAWTIIWNQERERLKMQLCNKTSDKVRELYADQVNDKLWSQLWDQVAFQIYEKFIR
jgi:hypothetical protein